MTDSTKGQIMLAIGDRLRTVTAANGYSTDVKNVYADKIPMGIKLSPIELPAIFLLDGPDTPILEHQVYRGSWDIRLQLWDIGGSEGVGDVSMLEFVRNVYKAIYADSAVAQRHDAFRALHKAVHEFIPQGISPDLNMIDANRVIELSFNVQYRTRLWDL